MQYRLGLTLSALLLGSAIGPEAIAAQRPRVGIGVGGGAVLGNQLIDFGFTAPLDGRVLERTREVNLEDVAVLSAHGEWYVTRHVALRAHAAWGGGRLNVETSTETDGTVAETEFESDFGDVQVTALDGGLSVWPWAPGTVGFAPFVTVGVGRYAYDFDAVTADGFFRADGRRSGRAWLVGIGADLNVWRSVTLRIEAVDHRVDSPLRASDFDAAASPLEADDLGDSVDNVRLTVGAHVYLPFRSSSAPADP